MRSILGFMGACLIAAVVPFAIPRVEPKADLTDFEGWPAHFEGRPIRHLPLTEREKTFAAGFSGHIGRFTDGRREIIMRWIAKPTRKLHRPEVCFRASGYAIDHEPLFRDANSRQWNAFKGSKKLHIINVRSCVHDNIGKSWPDISSWFWAAATGRTSGPWWAITVAEPVQKNNK